MGFPPRPGGHPGQDVLTTDRAVLTDAYAVIPRRVMRDIVTSRLPGWDARAWVLARPLTGLAETFAHYLMDVPAGGGSDAPEPDPSAQGVLYVTRGAGVLTLDGAPHDLAPGAYAYLPPGADWSLRSDAGVEFHWLRKRWTPAPGLAPPAAFVTHESAQAPDPMPGTDGAWATTRFVNPGDLEHDMHVNLVSFAPGAAIPFAETHVMEHGLFVLEGKAVYLLNRDWVEVEAGDYMWLRAFCPQACYAGGPGRFRYLLYKDVNRHMPLGLLPS
ncbi:MAG: bifunctional allantoicase/(S)-ureidoglycine aminohydrolase [Paracoccaceae bacterium]